MMFQSSASVGWVSISHCKERGWAVNCFCLRVGGVSVPLKRSGGVALLIDAKNEGMAQWYASYGALPLLDTPLSLLLPLTTIHKALEATNKL